MTNKPKDSGFIEEPETELPSVPDEPVERPLLSAEEIQKIKDQAKMEILADKKAAMKKHLLAEEKKRLQQEEGLTVGNSHMDEMVTINIDLPNFGDKLTINGRPYWHGRQYTVPRHVALSLQDMMYRGWSHQREIDGKGLKEFYNQKHVNDLYKVKGGGKVVA